jgi:hypothetical protein
VGLGGAIKFIPHPVTIGFTSGIALIIFSSQVRDLLGLEMTAVPAPFLAKWDAYVRAFDAATNGSVCGASGSTSGWSIAATIGNFAKPSSGMWACAPPDCPSKYGTTPRICRAGL